MLLAHSEPSFIIIVIIIIIMCVYCNTVCQTAAAASYLLFPTKRVLLLGSGRVTNPVVRLFNEAINMNIALTIATDDELQASELVALATGRATAKYMRYKHPDDNSSNSSLSSSSSSSSSSLSSSSSSSSGGVLSELVRDCDLVLSLLPATMHIPIAMEAIRQGKHLVTASYASQDMHRLVAEARAKGGFHCNLTLHSIPYCDTLSLSLSLPVLPLLLSMLRCDVM